jgi:class 3 adenylate cyclase
MAFSQAVAHRAKSAVSCATLTCLGGAVMPEHRKLAAILAADVVGYSKLAAADEERTLARLRALRSDLFDPTIALHHGRVVKRTGDGVLIEFRSVVDAARCAIEVQNGMVERNAGLPSERRIELRVGIHLVNDDAVRLCNALQARRQIGRLPYNTPLLRLTSLVPQRVQSTGAVLSPALC